jgi:hypothetical protein
MQQPPIITESGPMHYTGDDDGGALSKREIIIPSPRIPEKLDLSGFSNDADAFMLLEHELRRSNQTHLANLAAEYIKERGYVATSPDKSELYANLGRLVFHYSMAPWDPPVYFSKAKSTGPKGKGKEKEITTEEMTLSTIADDDDDELDPIPSLIANVD